jgi:hypothetical protein
MPFEAAYKTESELVHKRGNMARPVRYNMIGLLFISTVVNYIDRVNISVAAPFKFSQDATVALRLALGPILPSLTRGVRQGGRGGRRNRRSQGLRLTRQPSLRLTRAPAAPPTATASRCCRAASRVVRRCHGATTAGRRSQKICRGQAGVPQYHFRSWTRSWTVYSAQGRSARSASRGGGGAERARHPLDRARRGPWT